MDVSELCGPSSEGMSPEPRIPEHNHQLPSVRDPRTGTTTIAFTSMPATGTPLLNKPLHHETIITRAPVVPSVPPVAQPLFIPSTTTVAVAPSTTPRLAKPSSSPKLFPPLTATSTLVDAVMTTATASTDKHDPQQHNLSEAIATCISLCQDIQQLRYDSSDPSPLDDIAMKANELLHLLKQDKDVQKPEYAMIRQARNLQDGVRTSYRRRTRKTTLGQRCHSCHTTATPEWRRGPDGARTLCNACGLHYSKLMRRGSITVQQLSEASPPRMISYPNQESCPMDEQQESFITYVAQPP